MPQPIAWNCNNPRCRHACEWADRYCEECRWPRNSGQPVYRPAPAQDQGMVGSLGTFYQDHPAWCITLMVLTVLSGVVTWPLLIGFTLVWIGQGVWKLVAQKDPGQPPPSTELDRPHRSPNNRS